MICRTRQDIASINWTQWVIRSMIGSQRGIARERHMATKHAQAGGDRDAYDLFIFG